MSKTIKEQWFEDISTVLRNQTLSKAEFLKALKKDIQTVRHLISLCISYKLAGVYWPLPGLYAQYWVTFGDLKEIFLESSKIYEEELLKLQEDGLLDPLDLL